ncbi:hypothetical protein ACOME3_000415 [Neoechinorhynchus agilis]
MADQSQDVKNSEQELVTAFERLDKDKSSWIDKNEFTSVLTDLGWNVKRSEVEQMFDFIDKNRDGKLDFEEFRKAARIVKPHVDNIERNATKDLFEQLDTDKSGKLDFLEVQRGLTKMGLKMSNDDLNHLFDVMDVDKSGHIDFEEFCKVVHIAKIA